MAQKSVSIEKFPLQENWICLQGRCRSLEVPSWAVDVAAMSSAWRRGRQQCPRRRGGVLTRVQVSWKSVLILLCLCSSEACLDVRNRGSIQLLWEKGDLGRTPLQSDNTALSGVGGCYRLKVASGPKLCKGEDSISVVCWLKKKPWFIAFIILWCKYSYHGQFQPIWCLWAWSWKEMRVIQSLESIWVYSRAPNFNFFFFLNFPSFQQGDLFLFYSQKNT